jgi:hypothetical protein
MGLAGVYVCRGHHPQAHAFLSAGVDIPRHLHRVFGVTGVKTAAMAVFQALLAAHEYFPQWPFM